MQDPKTITSPSTNRAQSRVTSIMRQTMLPLHQTSQLIGHFDVVIENSVTLHTTIVARLSLLL